MIKYKIRHKYEDEYITYLSNELIKIFDLTYGYIKNNKIIKITDYKKQFNDFKKNWKLLKKSEIEKFKVGICFDIPNLFNFKNSFNMFISNIKNENINSHVFIINEHNDKYYLLCFNYEYIYEFRNINDLLKYVIKEFKKDGFNLYLTTYKDKKYGESYNEFITKRLKNINKSKNNLKDYNFKVDSLIIK